MNLRNYLFSRPSPPKNSKRKLSEKDLQDIRRWKREKIQKENKEYRQQNLKKLQQQNKKESIQRQKISNLQLKEEEREYERKVMYEKKGKFFKKIRKELSTISYEYNKLLQQKANENIGSFSRTSTKQYMKKNHHSIIKNFREEFKDIVEKIMYKMSEVKEYTLLGNERKNLFLEVVVYEVIFQNIDISGNIKSLLGNQQKAKLDDNLNNLTNIRNIYADYPLLCYLIETYQIQNFVTDNKVFHKFFDIIERKNNTILIVDNFDNSYYLHQTFLHPKLYDFFLSLVLAQTQKQKQIQFQIRNQIVPEQESKFVNKKVKELLGY